MTGSLLEAMIAMMVAHPELTISAEVIVNGQRFTLKRWANGSIVLRPKS